MCKILVMLVVMLGCAAGAAEIKPDDPRVAIEAGDKPKLAKSGAFVPVQKWLEVNAERPKDVKIHTIKTHLIEHEGKAVWMQIIYVTSNDINGDWRNTITCYVSHGALWKTIPQMSRAAAGAHERAKRAEERNK